MNRLVLILGFGLVLMPIAHAAAPAGNAGAAYRSGEVLIKYRDHGKTVAALAMKQAYGLETRQKLLDGRLELVQLPSLVDVPSAIAMLREQSAIEYAEPNFLRRPLAPPSPATNDPLFPQQWGLQNTGQANFVNGGPAGTYGADMNLVNAWYLAGGTAPDHAGTGAVIVAIVDDAFETTHPDLAPNLSLPGYNATNGGSNVDPTASASPAQKHGTSVAGCVAAAGNNSLGVVGAAWNEKLLPIKFDFSVASEVAALDYARTHGARIVNASFGGPSYTRAEYDAISALNTAGILFVTAAGNENSNLDFSGANYPANYQLPNIVAVAATNRQDGIASFSTYGPVTVPVAAPGLQIVTTAVGGGYTTNGISGTSFSAPYAAGVAALIDDYLAPTTVTEVKARLIEGADAGLDPGSPANQRSSGGRINAARALSLNARPSIVIRPIQTGSYSIDYGSSGVVTVPVFSPVDDGTGRVVVLNPGATSTIRVQLTNLWQAAAAVSATLSASGGGVTVNNPGTPVLFGPIAANGTASGSFSVSVPANIAGHQYVNFALSISANAGVYTATRHFTLEIGQLKNSVAVQQAIQSDLYDEFHTWHYDVTSAPAGSTLSFQTTASNDVDIIVSYAAPAQYDIELSADPTATPAPLYFTSVPKAQVGGATRTGTETVTISTPQVGTYYVTVVNFDQKQSAYTITATQTAPAGGTGGAAPSSGGGAFAPWTLAGLLGAGWRRRRRRHAP
ncbi:MAG: hypothetical protein NVS9B10_17430 [Nevskia sp.]